MSSVLPVAYGRRCYRRITPQPPQRAGGGPILRYVPVEVEVVVEEERVDKSLVGEEKKFVHTKIE